QPKVIHYVYGLYRTIIFLGLLTLYCSWKIRRGDGSEVLPTLLVVCLVFIVLPGMVLSASVAPSASVAGDVNILNQQRVGIYDTATLSSTNGKATIDWLNSNGFNAPTNFLPAI